MRSLTLSELSTVKLIGLSVPVQFRPTKPNRDIISPMVGDDRRGTELHKEWQMSGKRARVGVIGTGWWATNAHLPSLTTYSRADVGGVADLDVEKARMAAERFNVPLAVSSHHKLFEAGVEGVVIATPHHTHYELARDALLAGVDVMIEKPMVVEPAHARHLVQLAREHGRHIHVGYPYPFSRHARLLRKTIEDGDLGDILFCSALMATAALDFYRGDTSRAITGRDHAMFNPGTQTYSNAAHGGGQALTQITHQAALVFHLTGLKPVAVHAFTGTYGTEVDVWDAINFRTASGAAGSIASTGTVPAHLKGIEEFRIFGSKGHATLELGPGTLTISFNDGRVCVEAPLTDDERFLIHHTARQLVDTILGLSDPMADGDLGCLTVEFLAAALESSKTGKVIELKS
jgi:predicted dehydrogenase